MSSCDACGLRTRRASARFCPSCGGTLAADAEDEVEVQPEAEPPNRHAEVDWKLLRPVAWLFCVFLALSGALFAATSSNPAGQARYEAIAMGLEAAIVLVFACGEREALWSLLRPLTARDLGRSAVAAVGVLAFVLLYLSAARALGIEELSTLRPFRDAGWPMWTAFALIAVAAPIYEELAFRGYIYARVARVVGERDAIFIQAGLFAVVHLLPMVFVSHFVIGLVLGALRRASSSLLPSMLVHATWNALVLGLELGGRWP